MAESVTENSGFSQDLFSPLQFCEVVEEGQQQKQHMQQLHHQSHLNRQQITTLQPASQNHIQHEQQHHLNPQQPQITSPDPQMQQHSQSQSIKQETSQQSIQPQLLNVTESKSQSLLNTFSSMEIYLTNNPVHLQTVTSSLVSVHQPHLTQPMYEVQLTRQQQQTLQQIQLSPLHLSNHPQVQNIQIPIQNQIPSQATQTHQSQGGQQQNESTTVNVGNLVSISNPNESFVTPITTIPAVEAPSANTVATQTNNHEDDEPEIIFTSVSKASKSSKAVTSSKMSSSVNGIKQNATTNGSTQLKPIPVKRTWRRPWKKKKEREKKRPVKRVRRVARRRRVVVSKKSSIHIDPRYGPPIDTDSTLVERETEVSINQLKQKRQRIKLNRNSGREYVNRLGKIVKARKIGSPCNCPLKCWDRMGSKVVDIFNNFWDLCDFNFQNSYLFTCLKLCDVKRRYTKRPAEESRRQNTFEYFVRISGKHLKVCKKAFMSAHGLTSDKRLRTLFTQMKDGALIPLLDKRGKHLRSCKNELQTGQSPNPLTQNNSLSNHLANNHTPNYNKANTKPKANSKSYKKKPHQPTHRIDVNKQAMYVPPPHTVTHIHPHCTPPPPTVHGTPMHEPPHTYIPNGDIYFPGHYLDPHQAMTHSHMNQLPACQKMLDTPAYFMAGMKENTFHQ